MNNLENIITKSKNRVLKPFQQEQLYLFLKSNFKHVKRLKYNFIKGDHFDTPEIKKMLESLHILDYPGDSYSTLFSRRGAPDLDYYSQYSFNIEDYNFNIGAFGGIDEPLKFSPKEYKSVDFYTLFISLNKKNLISSYDWMRAANPQTPPFIKYIYDLLEKQPKKTK